MGDIKTNKELYCSCSNRVSKKNMIFKDVFYVCKSCKKEIDDSKLVSTCDGVKEITTSKKIYNNVHFEDKYIDPIPTMSETIDEAIKKIESEIYKGLV